MTNNEPVHFRGIPSWAKITIVFLAVVLAALNLGAAWVDLSNANRNLSFGKNDVDMIASVARLGHTGSESDQVLVVHTLNTIVHLKAITNHQALAGLAIAAGTALLALGFALFLIGADGAFQMQYQGKDDGKIAFYATAPGLLCFALATVLIAIGATRKQSLQLGDFPTTGLTMPQASLSNRSDESEIDGKAGEGNIVHKSATDDSFAINTQVPTEKTTSSVMPLVKICIDRQIPYGAFDDADSDFVALPALSKNRLGGGAHIALMTGKKWHNGSRLKVRFLDGDLVVQRKVQKYAEIWTNHANITFEFGSDPEAEIRVSFSGPGAWSYIGTDNLRVKKDRPTMNFGWLSKDSPDAEIQRVVLHEFGHALGAIHEYHPPKRSVKWNRPFIERFFAQSPNKWTLDDTEFNFFRKYGLDQLNRTQYDGESIMVMAIPSEFTLNRYTLKWNDVLSENDKQFIRNMYPRTH